MRAAALATLIVATACTTAGLPPATFPVSSAGNLDPVPADPSPGCHLASHPPSGRQTFWSGDRERHYQVRVPPPGTASPLPLVLNLHGLVESPHGQEMLSGMDEPAARRGFLLVYPQGVSWSWNAGSCCGRAYNEQVDDVRFIRELVDRLERDYCVDRRRVFATGMSNGAFMSYRLACEAADLFAAVAPVAGIEAVPECHPARPVPLLAFHGRADMVVPYGGGFWTFPGVEETVQRWQQRDGCAAGDLVPVFEKGRVLCRAAQACAPGDDVVLCSVKWGGHTWPGGQAVPWLGYTTEDVSATETILDFFASHPRR